MVTSVHRLETHVLEEAGLVEEGAGIPQSEHLLHTPPTLAIVGPSCGMCDPCPFRGGKSGESRKSPGTAAAQSGGWQRLSSLSRHRGSPCRLRRSGGRHGAWCAAWESMAGEETGGPPGSPVPDQNL